MKKTLSLNFSGIFPEAGCDEAGRGCIAGPVVAAAVIFPKTFEFEGINDSKKINEKNRAQLRTIIIENALAWAVAFVDHRKIDEINILNASILAMHLALDKLSIKPQHIIVDGNRFKQYGSIPFNTIIKGDGKYLSIAAASILAKTERDAYMKELDIEQPQYGWARNKGYPTPEHQKALIENGPSNYHRTTFHLKKQIRMDF